MTAEPSIDVRDLNSVRRAAADADVVLGDDWVVPSDVSERDLREKRRKRGLWSLRRSPLARKIITFNLLALIVLVSGLLYLSPSRESLAFQRANGLVSEAELIADTFEAQLPATAPVNMVSGDGIDATTTLSGLDLRGGAQVLIFSPDQQLVASARPVVTGELPDFAPGLTQPVISNFLTGLWNTVTGSLPFGGASTPFVLEDELTALLPSALSGETVVETFTDDQSRSLFVVATPILQGDQAVGAVAVASAAGEIDMLVAQSRELVLQMFVLGVVVSVGLGLILASTIANPLAELADAAEFGRAKNARKMSPSRIRIPDLTARPDEIGRLSGALRGMVSALYDRIEGNEQFAADVAHEIKNPLASLRSAVGTMQIAKREDQRAKMLEIMEHDVNRLDRLVSDIASASRLDSELVRDEEEPFNLLNLLSNLSEHLGRDAEGKGIDFIVDLPSDPIVVHGLEARLAQVFVNLITNAISFCEDGDAIRLWARRRDDRVLVVVEDTGPGIPEDALNKVFQRFYSERPEGQFGNNSGLGLAISKQIVEAHGGVIWAENIRPTAADLTSDPLGARFVVGLPV